MNFCEAFCEPMPISHSARIKERINGLIIIDFPLFGQVALRLRAEPVWHTFMRTIVNQFERLNF